MPDISMCEDHKCPSRNHCWRYIAPPTPGWQAYADFERPKDAAWCDHYWPEVGRGRRP